ncbi:MAG TPA: hypothetical protein ENK67_02970 [Flavobacteriia bacterium]|nr:hypothetical protein [Flavobacteriia bacterium]
MNLEQKITQLQDQFDFKEPNIGHFNRFEKRLQNKQPKKRKWKRYSLIASVVLLLLVIGWNTFSKNENTSVVPEFQQSQMYFATVIKEELKKVESQKTSDNRQIINDALLQMDNLEKEFKKLQKDLKTTQNKKAIIYAMLDNYQQRIKILQNLLSTLENYKQLKKHTYEVQNS